MGFVLCASVFSGYPPYISTVNVSTPQDTSFEPGPYPRAQAVLEIHASKVEALHRLSAVLWSRYMGCKLYLRWSTPPQYAMGSTNPVSEHMYVAHNITTSTSADGSAEMTVINPHISPRTACSSPTPYTAHPAIYTGVVPVSVLGLLGLLFTGGRRGG